ncbi:hypothetical protein [Thiorhodococcus minor]|uniref:Uncharacterized protein n=1 Tax=Thiorhodococcus minor TaxID=57489 RepID=A0A6M0JZ83_9GAMM|nr:hypothetical protein [Thiorhodococcus minor]NEV62818.1 hypothetical protein [Thiorhodococcus minor]
MFAKNTLASAVAAAIGVSAVGVAQADSVFFPYAAISQTVTTIASVINTTANNWDQAGNIATTHLHYRFYYKSGPAVNDLLAPCEEYNEYLPTSQYDIQTIDLGGIFAAETAGVMFNDPSINNKWAQTGRDYAFGRNVAPARGYLYVDNSDGTVTDTLAGEAFMFEFGSGAAWGYQAYNSDTASYIPAASESPSNVAIMPFDEITTAFFVTPVDGDQAPDFANNYRARVEFVTSARGDLYDRDENLISGTIPQDVVCVGRVEAADMLSDGTRARVVDGGWARLWNYRVVPNATATSWVPAEFAADNSAVISPSADRNDWDDGAVVIKLEYNLGGTLNGESVGGVFNNSIMFAPE